MNNGRPVNETRAQLRRLPDFFRYHAGLALARRDAVIPVEGSYLNYTLRKPIGVVGNCTPFNHPLMIMCKSLAPVFASGCTTVVKPSEYTPLTTLALARIFTEAGLPDGVFNVVTGLGPSTGRALCEHPGLNKLVLTGGTEAGQIAGAQAGRNFAHQTLELGGKTPVLVFPDFDVDRAVNYAAFGAFIGAGQTCVCGSRHIVHRDIYEEFVTKLAAKAKTIRIGDPTQAETQLGPVISEKQRNRILNYVKLGLDEGARLVAGGKIPEALASSGGYFWSRRSSPMSRPRCGSSRRRSLDRSLPSRLSRQRRRRWRLPTTRRSASRRRSAPTISRAPIASRRRSSAASSGSTTTTASTRPRPGAASRCQASDGKVGRNPSTPIST